MKSFLKKVWMVSFVLILTFACGISASAETQKQKALKAYANYMASCPEKRQWSTVRFGLAYVDQDSVPELIKEDEASYGGLQVFTYVNGKVKRLPIDLGSEAYEFACYSRKGIFRVTGGTMVPCYHYYSLKNGKASLLFGYDECEEGWYCYKYSNGEETGISKSAFQKLLKQYTGSTKITGCKYYNNTASNRKKYLGYAGSVPASIKLNKSQGTIYVGKSVQLKATVTGASKKVTWSSGNKSIAVVNSNGKVTGKKAGTTIITAKTNGKTAKYKVTVKKK